MKLLIVTQVMDTDHPILGFFHRWVEEFAKHCESVQVICLQEGKHSLPDNVTVYSLGKEKFTSGTISAKSTIFQKIYTKIHYTLRFYKLIWQLRNEYDSVFVHMNQIYVILGAPLWRAAGKKIGLWYVHRAVTNTLYFAEKLSHLVFTSSKFSFNLNSKKVHYLAHGIDTSVWRLYPVLPIDVLRLVYVGRITPIKNIDKMIDLVNFMNKSGRRTELTVIGAPILESDFFYQKKLKEMISEDLTWSVKWVGSITQVDLVEVISRHHIHLNFSPTGGVDKSVLEALAMGIPSVVVNESFVEIFPEVFSLLTFKGDTIESAVPCIDLALSWTIDSEKKKELRGYVVERTSLPNIIAKIATLLV